jgi:hypothetical protein
MPIINLCECKFIRASLWLNAGVAMLFWWTDKWESWEAFLPGAAFLVGLGALGTFVRYCSKRKAMLAIPSMPVWIPPSVAVGNVVPFVKIERKRD